MEKFLVYRRGFNAANNSSMGARPEGCTQLVATVEATGEEEAVAAAIRDGVTVYNGQGIYARPETDVLDEEAEAAEKHAGQVLVKYWCSTTALESWCSTVEEIDDCLDLHSNSYPPTFEDCDGDELDYECACYAVGGEPNYSEDE